MSCVIVMGGGFCGLVAARVLSDYFDEVLVIERDRLLNDPGSRKGVPQSDHLHWLMIRGQRILEKYFPGIDSQIESFSCPRRDQIQDIRSFINAEIGFAQRFASGLTLRPCSRPLLEMIIRERVRAIPQVKFLDGRVVTGMSGSAGNVSDISAGENLKADLFVSTLGRNKQTENFIQMLTGEHFSVTEMNAKLGYATAMFEIPENYSIECDISVAAQYPANPRSGVLRRIEGNWVQVMLVGFAGTYPPLDHDGFLKFAGQLAHPCIYEAIQKLKPVGPVNSFRNTANYLCHYEKMKSWPDNLIVMGDAFRSLNPFYGQGMTASLVACETLDFALRRKECLGKSFQMKLSKALNPFWSITKQLDDKWVGLGQTQSNIFRRLKNLLKEEMMVLSYEDRKSFVRSTEVRNHLRTPLSFLTPKLVAKTLKRTLVKFLNE